MVWKYSRIELIHVDVCAATGRNAKAIAYSVLPPVSNLSFPSPNLKKIN